MTQTYRQDIPSIRSIHPDLPLKFGKLDLDRAIVAGQPLDSQNLDNARSVANALEGLVDSPCVSSITPEAVQSARLRLVAIESAHASAVSPPADIEHQLRLLDQRLDRMAERFDTLLALVNANAANNRIMAYNADRRKNFRPLQKTIPGDGYAKASPLCRAWPNAILAPDTVPAIGQVPPNFNGDTSTYEDRHILDLIVFYNDDFGITPGDELIARRNKLFSFLTGI